RRATPAGGGSAAHPGSGGAVVARRAGPVLADVLPPAAARRLRGATPPARLVPAAALSPRSPQATLRRRAGRPMSAAQRHPPLVSVGGPAMRPRSLSPRRPRIGVVPRGLLLAASRSGDAVGRGG